MDTSVRVVCSIARKGERPRPRRGIRHMGPIGASRIRPDHGECLDRNTMAPFSSSSASTVDATTCNELVALADRWSTAVRTSWTSWSNVPNICVWQSITPTSISVPLWTATVHTVISVLGLLVTLPLMCKQRILQHEHCSHANAPLLK
jgi:hypothetical protein